MQLLALLQQEGRFVDFLEENVAAYSDAEIGGAARVVHEGCRKVIHDYLHLEPVRTEAEGALLTLPAGFDAAARAAHRQCSRSAAIHRNIDASGLAGHLG